jgi:large conductance mechanosensitive channel
MLSEFKQFALKGNVVDMAVGIIIGAAFGKIVTSLVNDMLMPPIGSIIGNVDFSNLAVTLREKTTDHPAIAVRYGLFINTLIDFLLVAFALFWVVKGMNRLKLGKIVSPESTTQECPYYFSTISAKATRCAYCTSEVKSEGPTDHS